MNRREFIGGGYLPRGKGSYSIYRVMGHYYLYIDGEFWSSGDSLREVEDEIENWT